MYHKSRENAPATVRERLGVEPETPTRPRRERKRPRPGDSLAPKPAVPAEPESTKAGKPRPERDARDAAAQAEPKATAEPSAAPVDAEARDAYKAGLALQSLDRYPGPSRTF